jgi:hypothetical protein
VIKRAREQPSAFSLLGQNRHLMMRATDRYRLPGIKVQGKRGTIIRKIFIFFASVFALVTTATATLRRRSPPAARWCISQAPLTARLLVEIGEEAGVPPGVWKSWRQP